MSEEAPKLYTNKPKKAQLKQFQEQQKAKDFSNPTSTTTSKTTAAAASYRMGSQSTAPPPPPPPPPKEPFARRYRFLVPIFLTANLAVGAYLFLRTKKKDTSLEEEVATSVSSTQAMSTVAATSPVTEKPILPPTIPEPLRPREPIPEDQQRELFKWILEEKRKVKPKDPEEKKGIDEEKAILKQFVRAKSIPSI